MSAAPLPYPVGEVDGDGLDGVERACFDASAVEGMSKVHEGCGYYAERIIRRAIQQGNLRLAEGRAEQSLTVGDVK